MSLLHDPHHDGSPLYVSDEAPELGDDRHRARPHERGRPGRGGLAADDVRRRAGLPPDDVDHHRRRGVVGGRAAGAQPGHALPLPPRARPRRRGGRAGVADRRRAGGPRRARTPPTSGWPPTRPHPTGVATASSTRSSPTASPARPRPTSGRSRTGRCRRSGTTRSSSRAATRARRCSSSAATSTASPSTSTTSPRSAPTSSTRRRSSPARATTATTRPPSPRSTRCSAADEAYARLSDRRPRARLADPGRPHHQPHRRHPRVVPRGGRRPARPAPLLLLLRRRRHLRRLDGPRHAAQDQPRRPRRPRTRWSTGPTPWSGAGCSRPTTSTAGASTSPT